MQNIVTLGEINDALKIAAVTAAQLADMGFAALANKPICEGLPPEESRRLRNAKLYPAESIGQIRVALAKRLAAPALAQADQTTGSVSNVTCQPAQLDVQESDNKTPQVAPDERKDLVPGVMRCAKCEFQLVRQVLAVNLGKVFAGDSKTEPCPNGCGPLWPVTWKQYAEQAMDAAETMADRAFAAEKEVKQLRGELAQHPDDVAVDALASLMRAKLAKQRDKGYGGWNTEECTQQRLSDMLRAHVEKGDPVDVANFCAFLSARGEGIAAPVCKQPKFAVQTGRTMTLHFADDAAALAFYRATQDGITPAMAAQAAPAAVAVPDELNMDAVLSMADVHAVESLADGVRHFDRGGLYALAKDIARAALDATPAAPELHREWRSAFQEAIDTMEAEIDSRSDAENVRRMKRATSVLRSMLAATPAADGYTEMLEESFGITEPAAAAPVVLPELDVAVREVMGMVAAYGLAVAANSTWKPQNSTLAHSETAAYNAIKPKLRALLAGVSAPAAQAEPVAWPHVEIGLVALEWKRQKRLFPVLSKDGWMDQALNNLRLAHTSATPQAKADAQAVERGEVLVTVSGFTGSGKSAIAGEIEIMCRALGLQVEWPDGDSEKNMTHADWTAALELYKPRVRIVENNIPRASKEGPTA